MNKLILLFTIIACAACSSQLYIPTEVNVNKVETASLSELQKGHDLFQNNCGKCHKIPKPDNHTNQQWVKILENMAPKAKLSTEQSDLVYKYIVNR